MVDISSNDCKKIFPKNSNSRFSIQFQPSLNVKGCRVALTSLILPLSFANLQHIPTNSISINKDGHSSGNVIRFKKHLFYPSADSLMQEINSSLNAYEISVNKSNTTKLLRIKVGVGLTLLLHKRLSNILGFDKTMFNASKDYYTAARISDPLKGFRILRLHSSIVINKYNLNNHSLDLLKTFPINNDYLHEILSIDFGGDEYRTVSTELVSSIMFEFRNLDGVPVYIHDMSPVSICLNFKCF